MFLDIDCNKKIKKIKKTVHWGWDKNGMRQVIKKSIVFAQVRDCDSLE